MEKPFEARNQSDAALRKLKALAKTTSVDLDLVSALAAFTWDYDPEFGKEPCGWVENRVLSPAAETQLQLIADSLELSPDYVLQYDQASKDLILAHAAISPEQLWTKFNAAVADKNYAHVSEYASFYFLRGLDQSRMKSLRWTDNKVGLIEIARNLFLKLFRGGSVDRDRLDYLWCDLVLPLKYTTKKSRPADWIEPLLTSIEALPSESGLKDLLACTRGLIGGDKILKQTVLESLAYADVLQVKGLSVSDLFLAERYAELSSHFYSNEWAFPLRFWSSNGGTVNRKAVLL